MAFPAGVECFNADEAPIRARGQRFFEAEMANCAAAVTAALEDHGGRDEDEAYLESVDASGFENPRIAEIFDSAQTQEALEDWRIGEAAAQAELEANRQCLFPWSTRRDLKNPKASPAGAELVGFHQRALGESPRFAFGEVKTSVEDVSPPSVNTSLKSQVKDLRDDKRIVDNLVRYLTPRARNAAWENEFREAFKAYIGDGADYSVFGVLIRDTDPKASDLKGMASDLAPETVAPKTIELRGIYFPKGKIGSLAGVGRSS